MEVFTNISTYLFAPLAGLAELREQLRAVCRAGELKGTIMLSPEGINLFVAGTHGNIDVLLAHLRAVPGLENLTPKASLSDAQPFRRMLVKIKKEIIAFGVEGIDPAKRTSKKLSAKVLKQWLDEGKPLTLLDTRNDYEIRMGTFRGAVPAGISHFRHFPSAVAKLPANLKHEPVVMFCTGGIRCEKAGPYMEREGFQNIFQLDGGILKYFQECGGAHYQGECFVFDRRVCVDSTLQETNSALCFACQMPLTPEEQQDSRYVKGISCSFCFDQPAPQVATRRQFD
ncbi:MAG: sulfurtransferase [Phycisphaerales bacterium]|nr:sulfurtransferase [Phycisphaerales bacterium]